MNLFAPESCHEHLLRTVPRSLSFEPQKDFWVWRREVSAKLSELLGTLPEKIPLDLRVAYVRENDLFREIRFVFTAELSADVPCHLLVPQEGDAPFPVVICLQGHSTGMHNSLGRPMHDGDEECLALDRDFALQAVREGYAALVIEQRCFGERKDIRGPSIRFFEETDTCRHAAMVALLLGRTMIGERVWDVSRAIDALGEFPEIDPGRIGCMGNSGGGMITYYASCVDERIGISMPSGYVCAFRDGIGVIDHCEDNYIPGILRYFDIGDLACLIAPRPLVVVAGCHDDIFPLKGVERAFHTISQIYYAAGASDKCRLVVGEGAHRFFADLAWPVFRALSGW